MDQEAAAQVAGLAAGLHAQVGVEPCNIVIVLSQYVFEIATPRNGLRPCSFHAWYLNMKLWQLEIQ